MNHPSQARHGLINFRDIGVSTSDNASQKRYIKEGMVFRSATMDGMEHDDVNDFILSHNIHTILDLRSRAEGKASPIDQLFPTTALVDVDVFTVMSAKRADVEKRDVLDKQTSLRKKYRIDFVGQGFQRNYVFANCSPYLKLRVIAYSIMCNRRRAGYLVGREVMTPMGVPNLYKQFLLHCKDEIRQALYTFTIPSNYPIHIHCTQGKDRTGLVSALVCGIAGVPTEIIVKDYAMSQPGLAPIYSDVVKHVVDAGLSKDFANALPETMRDVLHFIDEEFGSIEKYLVSIGFRKEDQERIREIICA